MGVAPSAPDRGVQYGSVNTSPLDLDGAELGRIGPESGSDEHFKYLQWKQRVRRGTDEARDSGDLGDPPSSPLSLASSESVDKAFRAAADTLAIASAKAEDPMVQRWEVYKQSLVELTEMGFTYEQADKALFHTEAMGVSEALDWLEAESQPTCVYISSGSNSNSNSGSSSSSSSSRHGGALSPAGAQSRSLEDFDGKPGRSGHPLSPASPSSAASSTSVDLILGQESKTSGAASPTAAGTGSRAGGGAGDGSAQTHCGICFDPISSPGDRGRSFLSGEAAEEPARGVSLPCNHRFCATCTATWLRSSLFEGKVLSIRCPYTPPAGDCTSGALPPDTLRDLITQRDVAAALDETASTVLGAPLSGAEVSESQREVNPGEATAEAGVVGTKGAEGGDAVDGEEEEGAGSPRWIAGSEPHMQGLPALTDIPSPTLERSMSSMAKSGGAGEVLAAFEKFRVNAEAELDATMKWCVTPGCETPLTPKQHRVWGPGTTCYTFLCRTCSPCCDRGFPILACPKCQARVCSQCGNPEHGAMSCRDAADAKLAAYCKEKYIQPCPSCRTPTYKIDACPHMTCRCGYQYCWVCRSPWSDGACQSLHQGVDGYGSAEDIGDVQTARRRATCLRLAVATAFPILLPLFVFLAGLVFVTSAGAFLVIFCPIGLLYCCLGARWPCATTCPGMDQRWLLSYNTPFQRLMCVDFACIRGLGSCWNGSGLDVTARVALVAFLAFALVPGFLFCLALLAACSVGAAVFALVPGLVYLLFVAVCVVLSLPAVSCYGYNYDSGLSGNIFDQDNWGTGGAWDLAWKSVLPDYPRWLGLAVRSGKMCVGATFFGLTFTPMVVVSFALIPIVPLFLVPQTICVELHSWTLKTIVPTVSAAGLVVGSAAHGLWHWNSSSSLALGVVCALTLLINLRFPPNSELCWLMPLWYFCGVPVALAMGGSDAVQALSFDVFVSEVLNGGLLGILAGMAGMGSD